jgi:poly [ADP-ribose] polymerase
VDQQQLAFVLEITPPKTLQSVQVAKEVNHFASINILDETLRRKLELQQQLLANQQQAALSNLSESDRLAGVFTLSGARVPLVSAHVHGKIIDISGRIRITQEFVNNSSETVQAKYVFPVDEMSAVIEFCAWIDGVCVKGVIEERKAAQRKYKVTRF